MLPTTSLIPLLAALVCCASAVPSQYYSLKASSNDSNINGKAVNAAGSVFWINRPTGRLCGSSTQCPTEPDTYLTIDGTDALLNPNIPQYAYVSEFGDFFFSEDGVPTDADEPHLFLSTFAISGKTFTFQQPSSSEVTPWLACPAGAGGYVGYTGTFYHVFAKISGLLDSAVAGGSVANCSEFTMSVTPLPSDTAPLHYD